MEASPLSSLIQTNDTHRNEYISWAFPFNIDLIKCLKIKD